MRTAGVIQSSDRTILQYLSDMVAELGWPRMDIVTTQSFQMVGKVAARMSSEEEDSVASFPAVMNNAVGHAGSSNESARICRTNTLVKTMNHLDELSREADNCWTWMKATNLDDEASLERQQLCSGAEHAGAEGH